MSKISEETRLHFSEAIQPYKGKITATLEKEVLTAADKLTQARKATAATLNSEVDAILAKLGMKGTSFTVQINQKAGSDLEQLCGPYGKDDIEFLISANPGNPPLPKRHRQSVCIRCLQNPAGIP